MHDFLILGLCGLPRTGKDTFFKIVDDYLPGYFTREAFADNLYHECAEIFHHMKVMNKMSFWELLKNDKSKLRPFVKVWATEVRRDLCDKDYWVHAIKCNTNTVITDVRFPNEAEYILSKKGILIYIEKDGIEPTNHPSDTNIEGLSKMSKYTIKNNGSLEDYTKSVISLMAEIGKQKKYSQLLKTFKDCSGEFYINEQN